MRDDVGQFLGECTTPGGRTQSSVLYAAYLDWRRERPELQVAMPALSEGVFYREISEAGYPSRKSGGVMVRDLALVDDVSDGQELATIKPSASLPSLDELAGAYCTFGLGMSARETAEHFDVPESWVRETLKAAGVRKADPPFSPDTLEAEDTDELVERGLEYKRAKYKIKAMRAERRDLERRAEAAESLVRDHELRRSHILEAVRGALMSLEPAAIVPPLYDNGEGWAAHAIIADAHVGLQVYGKESWTGENYHTDLAADRIVEAAAKAGGWIDGMTGMLGTPRVIHYSIVGDLFHALQYATVSGRPMQVDGRARRVFEKVVNAAATAIATLANVAPVEARITDGNHDGDLAFYAATTLAAYFNDVSHVSVATSYNHQCSFFEGETLHVLDHGRGWADLGAKKVGAEAANILHEIGEMYPPHRRAKIWVGDKHSPAGAWHGRQTEVIRVPALASLDDYAQGLNYSHDYDAYVYALTERGGIGNIGRLYE